MFSQLIRELFNSFFTVSKDNALRNNHVLVKLEKSSEFLTVFLKRNVELLDSFQSQLLVLHQDLHGILHELLSHLHNLRRHSGREKTDLNICREVLENLSDFINKASAEHLI